MNIKESEQHKKSADYHVSINMTLVLVVFAILPFIITIQPELLQRDYFLTIQLILTIPLLISSSLSRAKYGVTEKSRALDIMGYITFSLAFGLLLNSIGIMMSFFVPISLVLTFFLVNILMTLIYSFVLISINKSHIWRRFLKEGLFILILVFLGVFHVIGFY